MQTYFLRRLLLVPPTLLGITLVVFALTRFLPGGPVERALMEAQMQEQTAPGTIDRSGDALNAEQIAQLEAYFGFDKPWPVAYLHWLSNLIRGDLGLSYRYQTPVTEMIGEKIPISLYFGLFNLVITYSVCIPLGIVKALKHRTPIDSASSVLIFVGYAVPGYVLGALLLVFFAFQLEWFPTGGFVGPEFPYLTPMGKVFNLLHHTFLPLICYAVGSFAFLTLLMKNSLMDNLASDYMRTAVAKGVPYRRAVLRHALRNSFIPIATNLGHAISVFVAGSFLIEKIFNIDGFGLLGFNSLVERDYPIVMGVLLLSAFLLLIGNILSDICVALVDPRIRFQ